MFDSIYHLNSHRYERSEMRQSMLSKSVIERLPVYLHYIRSLHNEGTETVSATAVARALSLGEVQVRKDLGAFSGEGKPKIGYEIPSLIKSLEAALGYETPVYAAVIGAGRLGNALLGYEGFREYGLEILAGFDCDESKIKLPENGKRIYPVSEFPEFCRENGVEIGIITVPEGQAQIVCDLMVESGISAIWNFAPKRLTAPKNIFIKNENMASSLAVLSGHLKNKQV